MWFLSQMRPLVLLALVGLALTSAGCASGRRAPTRIPLAEPAPPAVERDDTDPKEGPAPAPGDSSYRATPTAP